MVNKDVYIFIPLVLMPLQQHRSIVLWCHSRLPQPVQTQLEMSTQYQPN